MKYKITLFYYGFRDNVKEYEMLDIIEGNRQIKF